MGWRRSWRVAVDCKSILYGELVRIHPVPPLLTKLKPGDKKMKFEFTIEEVNVIMAALARAPYEAVFQLIDNIRQQAAPQIQSTQAAEQTKE